MCNVTRERIKLLRKEKGITQQQLADEMNIDVRSVHRYEIGETVPSSTLIIRFAGYFHVTSDYLLGLSDNRE